MKYIVIVLILNSLLLSSNLENSLIKEQKNTIKTKKNDLKKRENKKIKDNKIEKILNSIKISGTVTYRYEKIKEQ